jgi:LacI family transcriptional regulator
MAGQERSEPTIHDVARRAGVSTATVSRALNATGQVRPATRWLVEEAVRELGYRPNTLARSLKTRTTQTIAFLLPDITNPFYPGLVKGVQDCAHEHGYTLLLGSAEGDPDGEEEYLNLLREKRVDGAVVDGLVLARDRIAAFVSDGFPIVSLDRNVDFPNVPLVQVNNARGARLATEHLLGLGHRRIAHVIGADGLRISEDRLDGYLETLREAGVEPDVQLIASGGFTEEGGAAATSALLERGGGFTAVFAANDMSAIGAIKALEDRGLRIPHDVSVVGFDDLRLAAYVSPALTTVRQPAYEMSYRAAELLFELIETGRRRRRSANVVFEPELIVRQSSGPAP